MLPLGRVSRGRCQYRSRFQNQGCSPWRNYFQNRSRFLSRSRFQCQVGWMTDLSLRPEGLPSVQVFYRVSLAASPWPRQANRRFVHCREIPGKASEILLLAQHPLRDHSWAIQAEDSGMRQVGTLAMGQRKATSEYPTAQAQVESAEQKPWMGTSWGQWLVGPTQRERERVSLPSIVRQNQDRSKFQRAKSQCCRQKELDWMFPQPYPAQSDQVPPCFHWEMPQEIVQMRGLFQLRCCPRLRLAQETFGMAAGEMSQPPALQPGWVAPAGLWW